MIQTFKLLWRNPYIRGPFYLLLIVLIYLFLRETRLIWINVLLAYTLAYLAHPLVTELEKRGAPRWVGVTLTMMMLIVILLGLLFIAGQVLAELAAFAETIPEVVGYLQGLPSRLSYLVPLAFRDEFIASFGDIEQVLQTSVASTITWLELHGGSILRRAAGLIGSLFQIVIILILTAYFLAKFTPISRSFLDIFPSRHRAMAEELANKADSVVGGYLRAQLLIAIGVGLSLWLGLTLLDVPLAAALGALAALANVVPLLGPIVAGIPALLLALTKGWLVALLVLILLLVINQVDGNIISPIVFARTNKIQPVTVIIAVTVGLTLFGLWGALVAVPVAAFIKLMYYDYYQQSGWYKRLNHE